MKIDASPSPVSYQLHGAVAVIELTRPEKRNAISDFVVECISEAVEKAQREARAAVIHGSGEHFCAGLDLAEHVEREFMEAIEGSRRWHQVFDRIERGRIPFFCALHGAVIGGGFELAASTQIRVADPTAFFALPEGQRGIFVGGGGSVRIGKLVGAARMADMMLTGRVLGPEEMERWGGVSYVVPEGEALPKAIELAQKAARNAPMTNYSILNALPRIRDMSSDEGLFLESMVASMASSTPEAKKRLKDFLERKVPKVSR